MVTHWNEEEEERERGEKSYNRRLVFMFPGKSFFFFGFEFN